MKLPIFPLSSQTIESVVWSSDRITRLKLPAGFLRQANASERILIELVQPEVARELERAHSRARACFGYKRRELLAVTEEPGTAKLITPDFEYHVKVHIDPKELSVALWRREITCRRDARGTFEDSRLIDIFGPELDSVEYRFAKPVSLADVIDRIEEREPSGVRVDYDSQCTWCEISMEGFPATLRLRERELVIRRSPGCALEIADLIRAQIW